MISAAETRRAVEKKVPDSETCGVSGPLRQISQLPHPRRGNRPAIYLEKEFAHFTPCGSFRNNQQISASFQRASVDS